MADARPLLERLLGTPDLARLVPHLPPDLLLGVIERCGLDDCAELVALATPQQLLRVLDDDLWRTPPDGAGDALDTARFGQWLEVLLQADIGLAVRTLVALEIDVAAAALARHVAVFDPAAISPFTTLDGEHLQHRILDADRTADIGGFVLESNSGSAWDAVVAVLEHLAGTDETHFRRLMRRCLRLSNAGYERDPSYDVLGERDQQLHDVVDAREARRTRQGHVAPAEAQAFLQSAGRVRFDGSGPALDPLWSEHRGECGAALALEGSEPDRTPAHEPVESGDAEPAPGAMADVIELLHDAGIAPFGRRSLLAATTDSSGPHPRLAAHVEAHPECAGELAFLANILLVGCRVQGRAFTRPEAADAASATCNLGLERWPPDWRGPNLVAAFQVGWSVLYREVGAFAARRLLSALHEIRCSDTDLQLQLLSLEQALARHLRDDASWRVGPALDVILVLDPPSWAALTAMIGGCPVMHAAVRVERAARSISATAFEFIACGEQIDRLHRFLEDLPARLVG